MVGKRNSGRSRASGKISGQLKGTGQWKRKPRKPSAYGLGNKPFRGPTPKNVFHVIEFGAGNAETIRGLALKHKNKHFIAVDPLYKSKKVWHGGIPKSPLTMRRFIREMERKGVVARRIMLRAPNPEEMRSRQIKLEVLFREAHNILLPNGKIYITSEVPDVLDLAEFLANENGLKVKQRRRVLDPKSEVEKQAAKHGSKVYILEVTYGLKKAFPKGEKGAKKQRREWARK